MKRWRVPIGKQGPVFSGIWGGSPGDPWGSSASGMRPLQHPLPRSRARVRHLSALRPIQDAFGVPSCPRSALGPASAGHPFFDVLSHLSDSESTSESVAESTPP